MLTNNKIVKQLQDKRQQLEEDKAQIERIFYASNSLIGGMIKNNPNYTKGISPLNAVMLMQAEYDRLDSQIMLIDAKLFYVSVLAYHDKKITYDALKQDIEPEYTAYEYSTPQPSREVIIHGNTLLECESKLANKHVHSVQRIRTKAGYTIIASLLEDYQQ